MIIDNIENLFLPDLCQITRFCDLKEIGLLQEKIRSFLNKDLLQMTEWSEESHLILERVTLANFQELSQLHKRLNEIESDRFLLTTSVPALHYNCTHYRDVIATRTMELVACEMHDAGCLPPRSLPYALLSMGSDGRKEQTLITDQDYLLVYGDNGGEDADIYFEKFSALLVDRLEETGFKKCTGDIMPTNPTWRGSFSQWRKRLLSIVRYEFEDYAKNMMDLIVLSDVRYVAGDRNLAEELALMIRGMERDYFRVLWGMAKAATEMRLALGFLKRIWTESSGEHKGEFNLKLLAWAPLVMNIRILAINQGVPATSTVERISMLEKEGSFSAGFSHDLHNAYLILTKHRILLQIKVLKGIQKDSYYLNPFQLPTGEIEKIHNALLKIEELQKIIHSNFSIV